MAHNMGEVLGGDSDINVIVWDRGHKEDWNHSWQSLGRDAWGSESLVGCYRASRTGAEYRIRSAVGGPGPCSPADWANG